MSDNQGDTLLDIVDRLTIEHPYRAVIEGRTRWVRRDPLIRLLREAIASSLTGGNGLASDLSKVPFDPDAMEQYDLLEDVILDALRAVSDAVPYLTPEKNLRAWYTAFQVTATDEDTELWMKVWSRWTAKIESKMTPPVVMELIDMNTRLPYECPECGMGWYEQILNSGPIPGTRPPRRWYDREKRVALTATYRPDGNGGLEKSAVECGCCGWRAVGSAGVRGFAWDIEKLVATR